MSGYQHTLYPGHRGCFVYLTEWFNKPSLSSVCPAGILWNMSSKDSLKEKLARETLSELTERVLVPLCSGGDSELIRQSPSEADIFYNTTGCLR